VIADHYNKEVERRDLNLLQAERAMWNEIAKYDIIKVWFEDNDEERCVEGEVTNYTFDQMVVREESGSYHVIGRDNLIDLDHISYADRNEVYRH
jgi:hypothetical protein